MRLHTRIRVLLQGFLFRSFVPTTTTTTADLEHTESYDYERTLGAGAVGGYERTLKCENNKHQKQP